MKIHQRGDFSAAKQAEKVVIHLTFNGRHFELPDGTAFDLLKKGAPVELRVPAVFLNDHAHDLGLHKREVRELLPPRTTIFARVDLRGIDDAFHSGLQKPDERLLNFADRAKSLKSAHHYAAQNTVHPYDGLIRIELQAPLTMVRTGQKAFQLDGCHCVIWNLHQHPVGASSLNHALTQISEFAEIHRASHTGNAFLRCLVAVDDKLRPDPRGVLTRLAALRDS